MSVKRADDTAPGASAFAATLAAMGNFSSGAPARGFATIDFETTGLFAETTDRAIEVAVVHSDPDGTITGQWDTLINPQRDLGRQDIHRIAARDILNAPIFANIAGELLELLSGRVIVAHNASFDLRFLNGELGRLDYWPGEQFAYACTMRLARTHLGSGLALADCCDAFGIPLENAHRASADAYATAQLLEAFLASTSGAEWEPMLASAPILPAFSGDRAPWFAREHVATSAPGFLARIVVRVPDVAETHEQAEYLALVERCLLDRYLSEHEKNALVALAEKLGIGRDTAERLHRDYFVALARLAWADGVVTDEERGDLELVAALLSISDDLMTEVLSTPPAEPAVAIAVGEFLLAPGDEIVLTGEMTHPRSSWEDKLRDAGFTPKSAVTKRIALVVAADPDSLSGKARKARDYGIPIVGESWLEAFLSSR